MQSDQLNCSTKASYRQREKAEQRKQQGECVKSDFTQEKEGLDVRVSDTNNKGRVCHRETGVQSRLGF